MAISSRVLASCVCIVVAVAAASALPSCGTSNDRFQDATVDATDESLFATDGGAMEAEASAVCPNNTCAPHWADCIDAGYCETNLNTSVDNCGACGAVCADAGPDGGPLPYDAVPICTDGGCDWYCAPIPGFGELYKKCNGTCDYYLCDVNNCGNCGVVCPVDDAGNQVCNVGTCGCPFGTVDCDGVPECGQECKDLNTDPMNCGKCGRQCPQDPALVPFHETYTCNGPNPDGGLPDCTRVCVQQPGNLWLDCNGDMLEAPEAGDGCETFGWGQEAGVTNCGACGKACAPPDVCHPVDSTGIAQECGCPKPLSYCPSYPYCRNLDNDPYNCGSCGHICPTYPNTEPTCTGGVCGYQCIYGYADCDHLSYNGCEVNILSDPNNCGGCVKGCDASVGCGTQCQKNSNGQYIQQCQNGVCATQGCVVN